MEETMIPKAIKTMAQKIVSKENTRYALSGVAVHLNGEESYAAATDGRKLVKFSWTNNGPEGDAILDSDDLKRIPTGKGFGGWSVASIPDPVVGGPWEIATGGGARGLVRQVEGKYPNLEPIMPTLTGAENRVTIDLQYLGEICETLKKAGFTAGRIHVPSGGNKAVTIQGVDQNSTGKSLNETVGEERLSAVAVVMPIGDPACSAEKTDE